MTTALKSDVSTQDWVKKFHFENKVDLNLQAAVDNESTKIEVDEIPAMMTNNSNNSTTTTMNNSSDSYLQSILSASSPSQAAASNASTACTGSQTCACYKCQRQRRRAGVSRTATPPTAMKSKASPNVYTPLKKIENASSNADNLSNRSTEAKSSSSSTCSSSPSPPPPTAMAPPTITTTVSPPTPILAAAASPSPVVSIKTPTSPVSPQQTQKPKRSSTLRKTPTLKSYEKHMPRPAYAQQDSIYRIEQDDLEKKEQQANQKRTLSTTNELLEKAAQDNYQISWKDEGTGDDLLTSLVTFQTIFEEKAVNENEGLSDLLEQRTKELKSQKLKQHHTTKDEDEELPPRLPDCLTLSYRNGPRHNPLTLYHTMKMNGEKERMNAYNIAFKHCVNANSGMRAWIKRSRAAPTRENSKLVQSANAGRKPTIKRSLLHPLASRRNKVAGDELLIYSASSENLSIRSATSKKSIELISAPMPLIQPQQQQDDQITDIVSTAHALLPNRQFSTNTTTQQNKIPYEHIDTPSRPRQNTTVTTTPTSTSLPEFKDNSSVSSSESANGGGSNTSHKLKKSRPGRLFSSLGRKTSMRSHSSNSNKASSIRSLEKIDSGNESTLSQEKVVLDDLCRILPHIERSQLLPYVQEANCDYMKALQLCKSAVISGKLS